MSSAKWRLFCLGLSVFKLSHVVFHSYEAIHWVSNMPFYILVEHWWQNCIIIYCSINPDVFDKHVAHGDLGQLCIKLCLRPVCNHWNHDMELQRINYLIGFIWVSSRNCSCLVTWFCYQLIANQGNKTVAVPWPYPYDSALGKNNVNSCMIISHLQVFMCCIYDCFMPRLSIS